jgi:transposase
MEAYSRDLRERIVLACDEGLETRTEIADRLGVSTAFIRKLLRQRLGGDLSAKPHQGGFEPMLRGELLERVRGLVAQQSDATLKELCQRLHDRGGPSVSVATMWRALRRLGMVYKNKSVHAAEQDRPDIQQLRRQWRREVSRINPKRLVFVDESGASTSMTRRRARGPKGPRIVAAVPQGHWRVLTMLGALRLDGMAAASSIPCPTDSDVFRTFVVWSLVPALRADDVVIWDNLWPHKAAGVEEMIRQAHARPLPLPPYSPDLSPIERAGRR